MTKRRGMVFFAVLMAAVVLLNILGTKRHIYTIEDKYRFPYENVALLYYPDLQTNACFSDLIFEGRVLFEYHNASDGEAVYQISISDIWQGEYDKKAIVLHTSAKIAKLHPNDRIVIFAVYNETEAAYMCGWYDTCILNPPDDKSFFIGNELSYCDGKTAGELKAEVQEILDDVSENGSPFTNHTGDLLSCFRSVGNEYYEEYLEKHPEKRKE